MFFVLRFPVALALCVGFAREGEAACAQGGAEGPARRRRRPKEATVRRMPAESGTEHIIAEHSTRGLAGGPGKGRAQKII